MKEKRYQQLGLICLILLVMLTGCTSSGIRLFSPILFMGEVRESSVLKQPLFDVSIYTTEGKFLGKTDDRGQFRVETTPQDGKVTLEFRHARYQTQTVTKAITGGASQSIELPVLYLRPDGMGEIHGKISREIAMPDLQTGIESETAGAETPKPYYIEGEYNLVTHRGKDWLLDKINGYGIIQYESAGGFYSLRLEPEYEEQILQELQGSLEIEYIQPNSRVELMGLGSNEPLWEDLWNLQMLELEPVWQYSTGEGVVVAVLDTLYNTSHPDLLPNLLPPLDATGREKEDLWLNKHGLHVAGTIGAIANGDGILGVAPNVSILPIRIFDANGNASVASLVTGIDLAIEHGAQVINMSLGTHSHPQSLQDAVQRAYQAGIVMVGAAGNYGENRILYPAAFPEVIAVGAVNQQKQLTDYSHVGPGLELMAPGGDEKAGVLSTGAQIEAIYDETNQWVVGYQANYTHVALYGTSMATPHVSGIVALLMAKGITDPDYIRLILRETAQDLAESGYDQNTGYGFVDPLAALTRLSNTYVFFGTISLETGHAELLSPVYQVPVDDQYEILGILSGKGLVIGWIDVNQNLLIDSGDYLGQSGEVQIEAGTSHRQDVELKWIEGEFDAIDIHSLF